MFYLAGAASNVLDYLGSLQQSAWNGLAGSAAGSTAAGQGMFSFAPPTTANPADAASFATNGSNNGVWSTPGTMNALLSEQGAASGGTSALLAQTSGQNAPVQGLNSPTQGSPVQGHGGHHHGHHGGGIASLLQSLGDESGTSQTTTNTDGSTTTTITYADGSTVALTMPPASSTPTSSSTASTSTSSSSSTGPTTSTASTSSNSSNSTSGVANLLERLIQQQAQMFAAAAGQNVSTVV